MSMGATRRSGDKVFVSDNGRFAFGLAGAESTMQLLRVGVAGLNLGAATPDAVRSSLSQVATQVLGAEYQRTRQLLGNVGLDQLPAGESIVGVYSNGAPALYHIAATGSIIACAGRFIAIGSARALGDHAYAAFRELASQNLTLHQAKMLVFRLMEDAIDCAGPNLMIGGAIQMVTVERGRTGVTSAVLATPDDPIIKEAVDNWVQLEAERFLDHMPLG